MSNYITDLHSLAKKFKALSNPHRLALFQRLIRCCVPGTVCDITNGARLCVGELGKGVDISPSTLSHHLKELHYAGLVSMERKGKNVECWVEPAVLKEISGFFNLN